MDIISSAEVNNCALMMQCARLNGIGTKIAFGRSDMLSCCQKKLEDKLN